MLEQAGAVVVLRWADQARRFGLQRWRAKVPAESRKLGLGIRRLVSSRIGVLGEIIRAPSDRHMPLGRDHDLDLRFAAVIGKVAG